MKGVYLGHMSTQYKPVELMIPHRSPFLFVDHVLELTPYSISCQKHIGVGDHYLVYSDGGNYYVSEAALIECLLQSGAYLMATRSTDSVTREEKRMYFVGSPLIKIKVKPQVGDILTVQVELTKELGEMARLKGIILCNSHPVLEGTLMVAAT